MMVCKYNYKKEDNIQITTLIDVEALIKDIVETYLILKRYEYLAVYDTLSNIKIISNYFLDNNEFIFSSEALSYLNKNDNVNDNDIYILTINYKGLIEIEEAYYWRDNNCIQSECATLIYIHDVECKSSVLDANENENILCYCFDEELIKEGVKTTN